MSLFKKSGRDSENSAILKDINAALNETPNHDERVILQNAASALNKNQYLGKLLSDLKWQLTPLAIKGELSLKGKAIYSKLVNQKYQTSTTGFGLIMLGNTFK